MEPAGLHPGDLLSNVPLSRHETGIIETISVNDRKQSFTGEEETEDASLRIALAECIFKFLGLDSAMMQALSNRTSSVSVESSPLFPPAAFRNSPTAFNLANERKNLFGEWINSLGRLHDEKSSFGDDESTSSMFRSEL